MYFFYSLCVASLASQVISGGWLYFKLLLCHVENRTIYPTNMCEVNGQMSGKSRSKLSRSVCLRWEWGLLFQVTGKVKCMGKSSMRMQCALIRWLSSYQWNKLYDDNHKGRKEGKIRENLAENNIKIPRDGRRD